MKSSSKFFAAIALLFVINFTATAQRGGQPMDADKMAERETTRMVEKLNLDETQTAKVQQINLTYANKAVAAHEDNKGNREAMQQIKSAIDSEKAAEIKLVLNEEQFKIYTEMQQRGGKGGKGGRGKKGEKSQRGK